MEGLYRHYHKRLNIFTNWLVKEKYIDYNFLTEIEFPKQEKALPRTLTKDEALLILDTSFHLSYAHHYEGYRNRAIIALMLLAGLRRSEVINLKLSDVCLKEGTIFIHQGKGKKDRYVPINAKLRLILQEYLKDRDRLNKQSISFITQVQKDASIEHRGISNAIRRIRERTKIYFSAHTLRHAFARLMLEGGCDIYTLSKIMGHAKITTTTIYLYCSNHQMHQSMEKHSLNL